MLWNGDSYHTLRISSCCIHTPLGVYVCVTVVQPGAFHSAQRPLDWKAILFALLYFPVYQRCHVIFVEFPIGCSCVSLFGLLLPCLRPVTPSCCAFGIQIHCTVRDSIRCNLQMLLMMLQDIWPSLNVLFVLTQCLNMKNQLFARIDSKKMCAACRNIRRVWGGICSKTKQNVTFEIVTH